MTTYPDEPHPDNEHQWESWWVARFFDPEQPLFRGDLEWVHRCWLETKARFYSPNMETLHVLVADAPNLDKI